MSKNITACVIVIGNEILSGRTQDLNVAYIGKRCDEIGIRLMETRIIPDVEATIVATINECRSAFTYVLPLVELAQLMMILLLHQWPWLLLKSLNVGQKLSQ